MEVVDLCDDDSSSDSQNLSSRSRRKLFAQNKLPDEQEACVKKKQTRYEWDGQQPLEKCVIFPLSSSDDEGTFNEKISSSTVAPNAEREKRRMSKTPQKPNPKSTKSFDVGSEDDEDSIDLTCPGPFAAIASPCFGTPIFSNLGIHKNDEWDVNSNLNSPSFKSSQVSSLLNDFQNCNEVAQSTLKIILEMPKETTSALDNYDTIIIPSASSADATNNTEDKKNNVNNRDDMMIPTPSIPVLNSIGGTLYPDLRHTFIRALINHAKWARTAAAQRPVFDAAVRAVVVLSVVRDHPIRTSDACKRIKGIGVELLGVLKEAEDHYYYPPPSTFSTVAPAVLVALLNHEQKQDQSHLEKDSTITCSIEELVPLINEMLDPAQVLLNRPIKEYLDKNNLDPHWGQIKKLCSDNTNAGICSFIKERRNKNKSPLHGIVYELSEDGRQVAKRLKAELSSPIYPPPLGPLRQLPSTFVHKKYKSVTMCVDHREGGGGSRSLHKLCDYLDEYNVPYVVRALKIADYVFFVNDKIVPVLIERKSAEDVACSLADGRWERQQRNMRKALYVLGGGKARRGHICYLIEGDANRRTVHGGNVGRRSWDQSVEDVEEAIGTLPKLGFSVLRSTSGMGSIVELAKVASEVSWRYYNGSLDCNYSYDEFIRLWKACDEKEGDPPSLAEHQHPAPFIVDNYALAKLARATRDAKQVASAAGVGGECQKSGSSELNKLSNAKLKALCKERFEKTTGTKSELIANLSRPRKPEVLITRMRHGQYVPKMPSCNAALVVALLLHCRPGTEGLTKETLMAYAQETGIQEMTKVPGSFYDGWSGMRDLTSGDPALVSESKRRYNLTTKPTGWAGLDVAKGLHILAHREGLCRCGKLNDL